MLRIFRRPRSTGYRRVSTMDPSASSTATNTARLSADSARPAEDAVFDYLPAAQEEYAAVEKELVRRIDWTLMPVMISMIVLKLVTKGRRSQSPDCASPTAPSPSPSAFG